MEKPICPGCGKAMRESDFADYDCVDGCRDWYYVAPRVVSDTIKSGRFDAPEQQAEIDRLRGALAGAAHIANIAQIELRERSKEIERLRAALEFYTDSRKYHISEKYSGGEFIGSWAEICGDSGNVARRALKEGKHE